MRWADKGGGGGGGGTDDQLAVEVLTSVNNFDGLLSNTDIDVQAALDTLDETVAGDIPVDATGFTGNLATTDDDVQAVADKVDGLGVLSHQDRGLLAQIPRFNELASDFRQKDIPRVWEAPANSNHGMAVFTGLITPTDAEIEAAAYVNPLMTLANTTTRIFVVKVDLGFHPGDVRVRETGLPGNAVYTISGSLFYLLHSDTLYDYLAHDVRVQNVRSFVLEEHELPDGHTEYRGEVRADQAEVDASGFDRILSSTDTDVQTALESLNEAKQPTDNTLKYNASDELAVNVTNVIDRLNETVEYYSDETGNEYDDGGSCFDGRRLRHLRAPAYHPQGPDRHQRRGHKQRLLACWRVCH